ncbi:MAG: ATP-binding protein [Clostridia bacterium]|nr:ATP-binding protein [Clostridia bacterium]
MALSSETVQKALYLKEQTVKKEEHRYETDLKAAIAKNPRIREIDTELAAIGTSLLGYSIKGDLAAIEECRKKSEALSKEKAELLSKAQVREKAVFCKACEDTGYVSGRLCECVKSVARELAVKELNDIMPLEGSGFDKFDISYYPDEAKEKMQKILSYCISYADSFSKNSENLLFTGKSGLGKTHLSLSIVKEVTKKGFKVIYGPAQSLFTAAEKERFSYSGDTEKLDEIMEADLLVIDDLGTEFMTNYVQSLFYDIVNSRLLKKLPTIISTNLSFEELKARYTPRIASRFIGEYSLKTFVGNDIRVLKKAKEQK